MIIVRGTAFPLPACTGVTMLLLKRILFAALLLTPHVAWADERADKQHYGRCLQAASDNSAAALADADHWARSGGGPAAEHCAALALLGLGRTGEAAARLDALARAPHLPDSGMRALLFDQAGNAYMLAGNGAKAAAALRAALTLSAQDADLFADLARAQAMQKDWAGAVSSLDGALALAPRRADLLVLRASAHRALKQLAAANADIDAALKLRPGDSSALLERGLLRRQIGDVGGARADFSQVVKTGGAAAAEARENLDSLAE